jgi:hypothetical protein
MLASLLGWVSKRHMTSRSGVFATQPARREPAARSNRLLGNRTHNRTHLGTDMGIAIIPHKNIAYLSKLYMV